jgi:hypothetical protein
MYTTLASDFQQFLQLDFISFICLFLLQKVEWFALEDHVKMCQLKGRSEVPPQLFHLISTTAAFHHLF